MENQNNLNNLMVTDFVKTTLLETAKWARFLAIIGFICVGLLVISGFFMGAIMSSLSAMTGNYGSNPLGAISGIFIGSIYLVIGLLYYFPIKYLYDFGTKVKKAITITDQNLFTEALLKLKAHYRYIGILMIIMLCFYVLMFVLVIVGAIFSAVV